MPRAAVLLLALVAPPLLGTAALAAIALTEISGRTAFANSGPLNSAEAVATGDAAVAIRLLRFGEDPTRVHPLRPSVISSSVLRATTLEAAMWSRRLEMIKLLDAEGYIVGRDQREALACLAEDLGLPDIHAYLAQGVSCVPGEAQARVLARTGSGAAEANR